MNRKLMLLGYDKNNNLLFKIKKHSALFIIDFKQKRVRLIKGYVSKSIKRKLREYMYNHHDLIF